MDGVRLAGEGLCSRRHRQGQRPVKVVRGDGVLWRSNTIEVPFRLFQRDTVATPFCFIFFFLHLCLPCVSTIPTSLKVHYSILSRSFPSHVDSRKLDIYNILSALAFSFTLTICIFSSLIHIFLNTLMRD